MKSPVPFYTDDEYTAMPAFDRAVMQAASQVDVEEVPRGSNWGPRVRAYLAAVKVFGPAYWCGAFVGWCCINAGIPRIKLPSNMASTLNWIKWATSHGRLKTTPQRGMLFVWNSNGAGHIGFVTRVNSNGTFETIEGNTNNDGSRNGYKVCRRTRSVLELKRHDKWGFIDLGGLSK